MPSAISSCFLAASFSFGMSLDDLVLPLLDGLRLLGEALALVVELDDAIDVGLDVAVVAVGFDGVEMFADEGGVQHGDACQ